MTAPGARLTLASVTFLLACSACGGGGGGGSSPPPAVSIAPATLAPTSAPSGTAVPTATPTAAQSVALPITSSGGTAIVGAAGTTTAVVFPPPNGAGATLQVTASTNPPPALPAIADVMRKPKTATALLYVSVTTGATLTLTAMPIFNANFVATGVAVYPPSATAWNYATYVPAFGNSFAASGVFQLSPNQTYYFALFGGTPASTPTPTVAPTATSVPTATPSPSSSSTATPTAQPPVASGACGANSGVRAPCSTYAVNSNPSGLTVVLDGRVVGTTPVSVIPNPAFVAGNPAPNQLTVRSGGSQPDFTVAFNQLRNGPQQVFYNRNVDTQGSMSTGFQSVIRAQSLSRGPASTTARRPVVTNLRERPSIDPARLFVKYELAALKPGGRAPRDVENVEGLRGGRDVIEANGRQIRVLSIPTGQSYESIAARLLRHSEVAEVNHVHLRYPLGVPVIPNDTHFQLQNQQWDMFQIGMPQAWSYTTGAGVTIAVLDTGYDSTSRDFSKVTQAFTFLNGSSPVSGATDTDGHGSNTAGIAAAVTNNGFGFAGVGFNTNLMVLKIIANNGSISTVDEANAVKFATDNGARVISMSIGGAQTNAAGANGYDDTEVTAINYALAHNVVVVASAGNESAPYTPNVPPVCNSALAACGRTNLDYPAAYPGVISVGASACLDNGSACTTEYVASYSNGGPGLGLVAPGGDPAGGSDNDNFHWIDGLSSPLQTNPSYQCRPSSQPDGVCANQFAGTSQAAPHVAGAAALVLALNPAMNPAQVAQLLFETADNLPGMDPAYQGHGRLNVARALAKLAGDSAFPAYRPAPNQFIAFAYTNSGATNAAPQIIDLFYAQGVPVNSSGNFRIADINPAAPYKIGVWYNAAGNGVVSVGDYFGSTGSCSTNSPCAATNITVTRLGSNVIP